MDLPTMSQAEREAERADVEAQLTYDRQGLNLLDVEREAFKRQATRVHGTGNVYLWPASAFHTWSRLCERTQALVAGIRESERYLKALGR